MSQIHLDREVISPGKKASGNSSEPPETAESLTPLDDDAELRDAVCVLASMYMERREWGRASDLLAGVENLDSRWETQLRLCKNLDCLHRHRPEAYQKVLDSGGPGPYQIHLTENQQPVPVRREGNGGFQFVSDSGDPDACLRNKLEGLKDTCRNRSPVCLSGIGDGRLLQALAGMSDGDGMGEEQAVFLVEEDLNLLWVILMMHDFSGEGGPIEQDRFFWCVGEGWREELKAELLGDAMLPFPARLECLSVDSREVVDMLKTILQERNTLESAWASELEIHYRAISGDDLSELFGENPSRSPRVLLITSRFSTVIQHSARDTAAALEELGHQTKVLIETCGVHRFSGLSLRKALVEMKPDAVLVIDHLRSEFGAVFPPELPFICWIQDHLQTLTNEAAGRSIQQRDFILTSVAPMYEKSYQYPRRQCIHLSKLTRTPPRAEDEYDLVYVSHGSATTAELWEQTINKASVEGPVRRVLEQSCTQLIESYEQGHSHPTLGDIGMLVDGVCADIEYRLPSLEMRSSVIHWIHHPLNNTLYRQQALRWVASCAEERGLRLGLYGRGWEGHPQFAKYAQGKVSYGSELEQLTRRARINLQIVPSFCLHQRLLDGLVAGGFYLIRPAPADTLMPELAAFIENNLASDICSVERARESLASDDKIIFEDLLDRCRGLTELGQPIDLIEWVRGCLESRVLVGSGTALPYFAEVSFYNELQLRERLEQFLNDGPRRATISDAQRKSIEQRLSYTAGMKRIMGRVGDLLRSEPET